MSWLVPARVWRGARNSFWEFVCRRVESYISWVRTVPCRRVLPPAFGGARTKTEARRRGSGSIPPRVAESSAPGLAPAARARSLSCPAPVYSARPPAPGGGGCRSVGGADGNRRRQGRRRGAERLEGFTGEQSFTAASGGRERGVRPSGARARKPRDGGWGWGRVKDPG